jgi:DNA polymerase
MRIVALAAEDDFEGWRAAARGLVAAGIAPSNILWQIGAEGGHLFADEAAPPISSPAFPVPRAFLALAETVTCHNDRERFALLHAMLLRLRSEKRAMEDGVDPLLHRLEGMAKAVRRDIHKMHAFLRFREIKTPAGPRSIAWFEPDHHIVRAAAPFFVGRFANMAWSILTPTLSLHWDGESLREGPGGAKADAPAGDPVEAVWKTYYAAIFNPARVNPAAMLKEMPKKYWRNLPETALVEELVRNAQARERKMVAAAASNLGDNAEKSWDAIRAEAMRCTRCHLHECATRTVFGEGPLDARILFVGEQPGDQEDLAGRPFVGPAGQLFDRALEEAGVDRRRTYVTNAVKHFKFVRRGKRRIHDKPDGGEIAACRWWLQQELALIRPPVTVALGATAARALFGKVVTVSALRGRGHDLPEGGEVWATVHPSFLLRVRDDREAEYAKFVADLASIGERAEALAR